MKESHYNMYMKNVETLDTTMGHHCAAASITTKRNPKVDLGKCVQMYRAPFLYLPGAPNSLNPPLRVSALGFHQKYLNLCSKDEWRSYWFRTTWGWVINDRMFMFGWTIPLKMYEFHCIRHNMSNQEPTNDARAFLELTSVFWDTFSLNFNQFVST